MNKIYICIDLKSFYASVECVERGLDPLTTNLVVADPSRTEKTICLAVSPSLKEYGLSGRSRLYEVVSRVKEVNRERRKSIYYKEFSGKSVNSLELKSNKYLELDYIAAPPRMAFYMKYSTDIYNIYLKYFSKDDIYVYSIDEVFIDITDYLKYYNLKPRELVTKIIKDIYDTTGITATSGIGTNLYLAKIAMDIVAKHAKPNEFGVRIAGLDEMTYRKKLWNYKPITAFWRVGPGIAKKLYENNMYTMGDICLESLKDENKLYKLFGVSAETLIDHAWGYEPVTIDLIKSYKPQTNSISSGQVLHTPYDYIKTKLIVREMIDLLSLDLVSKRLTTNQLVLTIGYDISNVDEDYNGEISKDRYGRMIPKHSHGSINLDYHTSSTEILSDKVISLYERIINKKLLVRRLNITANNLKDEEYQEKEIRYEQFDLFTEPIIIDRTNELKERNVNRAIIKLKNKYGKNAILKGMNLEKYGTTRDRNQEIGGHHE